MDCVTRGLDDLEPSEGITHQKPCTDNTTAEITSVEGKSTVERVVGDCGFTGCENDTSTLDATLSDSNFSDSMTKKPVPEASDIFPDELKHILTKRLAVPESGSTRDVEVWRRQLDSMLENPLISNKCKHFMRYVLAQEALSDAMDKLLYSD